MSAPEAASAAAAATAPRRRSVAMAAATLALGAGGGWLASLVQVPLAWMIGAMVVTTVASMAGLRLYVHPLVRGPNVAVLGVMLGSSFAPAVAARFADWLPTIGGLAVYVAVVTALLYWYFRRFGRFDRVTAFFAASPGGLNEMVIVGREMGGDDRLIALVHGARVLTVVLAIPIGFMLLLDYRQGARPPVGGEILDLPLREALILGACALAGALGARLARLPAAFVVGPMILSAAVHLLGWSQSPPPAVLVAVAQIVIGSGVGARFAGVSPFTVLRVLILSLGSTAIMIALTAVFAVLLRGAADTSIQAIILAYAPGGLAEMSLVALALAIDSAFVASHHVLRIMMIVVVAPTVYRLLRRGRGQPRA